MFSQQNVDSNTFLSLVKLEDADEIFALVNASRNYLREWLPWVDSNKTSQDTEIFIRSAQQQDKNRDGLHCCIRYKTKIAGIVGFDCIDWTNQTTEFGYWLGEQYQGLGLMTKCCQVLTDYAFKNMNLNRIEIRANNLKSCAIPERLAFVKEGTLRDAEWINDRFVDHTVYSMLRRDWVKLNKG